jgi:acetyl-CoA carboxylase biotin carboxyl carrier protein
VFMDFKQLQELIKLVNKSNIGEVTVEENGQKITVKQKKDPRPIIAGGTMVASAAPVAAAAPAPAAAPTAAPAPAAAAKSAAPAASNLITFKSPMIGTFYRRTGPDKPALVEVGSEVKPGSVLCIIEAMKLFNEIESEIKGKIVKVLVEDASPVEFDQPLFLIEP